MLARPVKSGGIEIVAERKVGGDRICTTTSFFIYLTGGPIFRDLDVVMLENLVAKGVIQYRTDAGSFVGYQAQLRVPQADDDVLDVIDRVVVVMNILHMLVACNWTYSRHPRHRQQS